jgi:hypothetical protein
MSLLYAGNHVRGVIGAGNGDGGNQYFPHADGIVNQDQRDRNDYAVIRRNLACALTYCPAIENW